MKTFDLAIESGNRDLVEYLNPAALSLACLQGDVKCVKCLINKYNCDPKGLSLLLLYLCLSVCVCVCVCGWVCGCACVGVCMRVWV